MSKGWTEERRQKQAERCRQNRPWENATDPKTRVGKGRSRFNALKHGGYSAHFKTVKTALRLNQLFLQHVVRWNEEVKLYNALMRDKTRRNELKKND